MDKKHGGVNLSLWIKHRVSAIICSKIGGVSQLRNCRTLVSFIRIVKQTVVALFLSRIPAFRVRPCQWKPHSLRDLLCKLPFKDITFHIRMRPVFCIISTVPCIYVLHDTTMLFRSVRCLPTTPGKTMRAF